jgi:hypothetical protein
MKAIHDPSFRALQKLKKCLNKTTLSFESTVPQYGPWIADMLSNLIFSYRESRSQVNEVTETDVVCTANSNSELDGLLTVFHTERSPDGLSNKQNDLPILNAEDKATLEALSKEFEIDFVSLSFTRQASDVDQARDYLKSIGLDTTRVLLVCLF